MLPLICTDPARLDHIEFVGQHSRLQQSSPNRYLLLGALASHQLQNLHSHTVLIFSSPGASSACESLTVCSLTVCSLTVCSLTVSSPLDQHLSLRARAWRESAVSEQTASAAQGHHLTCTHFPKTANIGSYISCLCYVLMCVYLSVR